MNRIWRATEGIRWLPVCLLLVVCGVGLMACTQSKRDANGTNPSAVNTKSVDHVVAMPDQFPNVATKCAGFEHYRVWVVTHTKTDTQPVIMKDESCP